MCMIGGGAGGAREWVAAHGEDEHYIPCCAAGPLRRPRRRARSGGSVMGVYHTPMMGPCPWCGKPHTGQVGEAYPRSGDIAICTGCLKPTLIEDGPFGLTGRALTAAEAAEWADEIAAATAGCAEFVRRCTEEGLAI